VGVLVAAGLIAGEALVGLVFATFAFFEVPYAVFKEPRFFVLSLIILAVVAAILIRVPLKNAGEKDA